MDQLTFRADPQSGHDLPVHRSRFRRVTSALLLACVLVAVLVAGFRLGRTQFQLPGWVPSPVATLVGGQAKPSASGPVVYYRDPNVLGGCPASSTFNSTQTGRVDWSL